MTTPNWDETLVYACISPLFLPIGFLVIVSVKLILYWLKRSMFRPLIRYLGFLALIAVIGILAGDFQLPSRPAPGVVSYEETILGQVGGISFLVLIVVWNLLCLLAIFTTLVMDVESLGFNYLFEVKDNWLTIEGLQLVLQTLLYAAILPLTWLIARFVWQRDVEERDQERVTWFVFLALGLPLCAICGVLGLVVLYEIPRTYFK